MKFEIKEPIWNIRSFIPHSFGRGVGIAKSKLDQDDITIEITYKDKDGNRVYPKPFKLARFKADLMPVKRIKGTELIIVPLSELQVLN